MPTRAYYAPTRPDTPWGRLAGRVRRLVCRQRDYTGWTVRAVSERGIPAGTVGRVVAVKRHDGELIHVVDFRPIVTLHVPLPWPTLELVKSRP